MAALFLMVNINTPVTVPPELPSEAELGKKTMVKVGSGTVTVKLIAAAVALSPWLLVRITAELVRTPAVVAVT